LNELSFKYTKLFEEIDFFFDFTALFLFSFLFCSLLIFLNQTSIFKKRSLEDLSAVQSSHTKPVSRIGGLALFVGIFVLLFMAKVLRFNISDLWAFVIAIIPIFLVGTAEDLGFAMSPLRRFLAICASSILMILLYDCWVSRVGIPYIDTLISYAPIGIIFTVFASAGVTNAFNLIDGLNGLAAFTAISISISLSIIAFSAGHSDLSILCLSITPIIAGFLVLNFPFGKIFLGDGGAYLLGHCLVWIAIYLMQLEVSISPFAILLIFFWPVSDTLLAIWRRKTLGKPRHLPDRLHFHQLTMRFLEIRSFGRSKRQMTNPLATTILLPLIVTPQVLGIIFATDPIWAPVSFAIMTLIFIATYLTGIAFAKKRNKHT
jgi:UDP-GlcNAc:undecaprenyl-phosphate GlcNAc-1-phosphate transferase